jgi:hypothetical protein
MTEWLIVADCKSVRKSLRRFESCFFHTITINYKHIRTIAKWLRHSFLMRTFKGSSPFSPDLIKAFSLMVKQAAHNCTDIGSTPVRLTILYQSRSYNG